jgi:hypothetical protein
MYAFTAMVCRGRGRYSVLSILMVLALIGCRSTTNSDPRQLVAMDKTLTRQYLDQLWHPLDLEHGGYRFISSFADQPSLYTTAWNLRIAAYYRLDVPNLDHAQIVPWLSTVIEQPEQLQELPPLQNLLLATQAFADLQQPLPTTSIARALDRYRRGEHYTYTADSEPSWAATQTAVSLLRLANLPVPDEVQHAVARDIDQITRDAEEPDDWINTFLPVWQIADDVLPETQRRARHPALAQRLREIVTYLIAAPTTGQTLPVLSTIKQIADQNRLTLPELDPQRWHALQLADGYFSLTTESHSADPQVTYYGLVLGFPFPPHLALSLQQRAGAQGWWSETDELDPQTSFYAIVLEHQLQNTKRDQPLRASLRGWIATWQCPSDLPQLQEALSQTLYIVRLAHTLQVPVSETFTSCIGQHLTAVKLSEWRTTHIVWLIQTVQALDVPLSAHTKQEWLDYFTSAPAETIRDVLALQIVGQLLHQPTLVQRARAEVERFEAAPAIYQFQTPAPVPDISSTAIGLYVTGALASAGPRALPRFRDSKGVWIMPMDTEQSNAATIETMYLGFLLGGSLPISDVLLH